ncbi:uncharacterized protein RJT21DRAFT_115386 [Scheffersomyces amazonensis]|uniref:uncharacterized protein n=1 Tax=Scheffersomyces amazonensis TaxID=1078765 RepID=UPI00315CCF2C
MFTVRKCFHLRFEMSVESLILGNSKKIPNYIGLSGNGWSQYISEWCIIDSAFLWEDYSYLRHPTSPYSKSSREYQSFDLNIWAFSVFIFSSILKGLLLNY